jgi:hypothetical protein
MNYAAMLYGAFGLITVVTIYYLFLRKQAAKPAEPKQQ